MHAKLKIKMQAHDPIAVLSPHIDDAIFSCWHLLGQPDVTVINVFAGIPKSGTKTLWDWMCGEPDSVAMMHKRLSENKTVLKNTGVNYINFDYLDRQYKPVKYNVAEMADRLLAQIKSNPVFYAPLAGGKLWRHPDHVTIRDLGKELKKRGKKVIFYADIPYMQMPFGPISAYRVRMSRRASKLLKFKLTARISELNNLEQKLKNESMHEFKSQFKATNLMSFGTLGRQANCKWEVTFE
jgi:hypothetical protein